MGSSWRTPRCETRWGPCRWCRDCRRRRSGDSPTLGSSRACRFSALATISGTWTARTRSRRARKSVASPPSLARQKGRAPSRWSRAPGWCRSPRAACRRRRAEHRRGGRRRPRVRHGVDRAVDARRPPLPASPGSQFVQCTEGLPQPSPFDLDAGSITARACAARASTCTTEHERAGSGRRPFGPTRGTGAPERRRVPVTGERVWRTRHVPAARRSVCPCQSARSRAFRRSGRRPFRRRAAQ